MIRLSLADALGLPRHPQLQVYRLAAGQVGSDLPLEALAPDALSAIELSSLPLVASPAPAVGDGVGADDVRGRDCRRVRGWLGGATREVVCRGGAGEYAVEVAGIGEFTVGGSPPVICCRSVLPDVSRARIEEVLLGPPMALALAAVDIWCLHASAILCHGRATLLLGNSGRGKSTLARFCDGSGGFTRIADDILPCSVVDASARAHPVFPQLKLAAAERYPADAEPSLPIGALVFLEPSRYDSDIAIAMVPRAEALHRAAAQTVAIGLFDRWLHERHLRFVARLLASVPAYALCYPHDYDRLPAVRAALAERLGAR